MSRATTVTFNGVKYELPMYGVGPACTVFDYKKVEKPMTKEQLQNEVVRLREQNRRLYSELDVARTDLSYLQRDVADLRKPNPIWKFLRTTLKVVVFILIAPVLLLDKAVFSIVEFLFDSYDELF